MVGTVTLLSAQHGDGVAVTPGGGAERGAAPGLQPDRSQENTELAPGRAALSPELRGEQGLQWAPVGGARACEDGGEPLASLLWSSGGVGRARLSGWGARGRQARASSPQPRWPSW